MKKILFLLLFFVFSLFAKIDINTADAKALSSIKGLGDKKVEAIMEYRNKNGKFKNIDELLEVKGIGKKLLENIKKEAEVR